MLISYHFCSPGFASYVQNFGGDHAYPGFNLRDQQLNNDLYPALEADALQSTKPLLNPVTNPEFDVITVLGLRVLPYSKGMITQNLLVKYINHSWCLIISNYRKLFTQDVGEFYD